MISYSLIEERIGTDRRLMFTDLPSPDWEYLLVSLGQWLLRHGTT